MELDHLGPVLGELLERPGGPGQGRRALVRPMGEGPTGCGQDVGGRQAGVEGEGVSGLLDELVDVDVELIGVDGVARGLG